LCELNTPLSSLLSEITPRLPELGPYIELSLFFGTKISPDNMGLNKILFDIS